MPIYEFKCRKCKGRFERIMHFSEYHEPLCECGGKTDQVFDGGNGGFSLAIKPGKETGFYVNDYGKHATWDLTVPGKMEKLKKEGIIGDPFEQR